MLKIKFLILIFILSFKNLFADEYFLTLRNDKVNLRQGPSFEYPIKLFYKKKFLKFNHRLYGKIGYYIMPKVSQFEIDAFAKWSNFRIPHEFEWEISSNFLNDKFKVWEWSENKFFGYKFINIMSITIFYIPGVAIIRYRITTVAYINAFTITI